MWDTRQPERPVAAILPQDPNDIRDCWSVAFGITFLVSHSFESLCNTFCLPLGNSFNDEERCVAAGYDNGDVKLFDLRTMSLRWEINVKNGVCCIEFDRRDIKMNKMAVAGLESSFRLFDMRPQHPTKGFSSLQEKVNHSTIIITLLSDYMDLDS